MTASPLGATRSAFPAFGATAVVQSVEPDGLDAAAAAARAEIDAIDLACDRTCPESELSRINARTNEHIPVSAHFAEAIEAALRAARLTDGLLNPVPGHGWRSIEWDPRERTVRIPPGAQLNLDATARALAIDRAAYAAHRVAECGVLVALDAKIAAQGQAPGGGWQVRLTDDRRNGDHAATGHADPNEAVAMTDGGLATSSTTPNALPTLAPSAWRAVTVAGITCVDAAVAATTALLRGESAARWLRDLGLPARLVRGDGSVLTLPGWPGHRATTDAQGPAEG